MLSKRAFIGWTTNSHVGDDIAYSIYHPKDQTLKGVIDNTEIGLYMASLFQVDLAK